MTNHTSVSKLPEAMARKSQLKHVFSTEKNYMSTSHANYICAIHLAIKITLSITPGGSSVTYVVCLSLIEVIH